MPSSGVCPLGAMATVTAARAPATGFSRRAIPDYLVRFFQKSGSQVIHDPLLYVLAALGGAGAAGGIAVSQDDEDEGGK